MAPANVRFLGRVSDEHAARLMAGCRAYVLTGVEEFGIAAVEAQAAGRPVIARRGGGVLDTVVEGATGCLWEGDAVDLAEAVRSFDTGAVDPRECMENAGRFGSPAFRRGMRLEVDRAVQEAMNGVDSGKRELRVYAPADAGHTSPVGRPGALSDADQPPARVR